MTKRRRRYVVDPDCDPGQIAGFVKKLHPTTKTEIKVPYRLETAAERRHRHLRQQKALGHYVPDVAQKGPRPSSAYRGARRNAARV